MSEFWGITRYEYLMGLRRWGLWLALLVATLPLLPGVVTAEDSIVPVANGSLWAAAGLVAITFNYLMPVVGGIAIADRLPRDRRLGAWEILASTPLTLSSYILGKYLGAVLAVATPTLAIFLAVTALLVVQGAPAALIPASVIAFLAINLPAYLFVGAFSLACPAVLPVRAYQLLFVGYWIWGNFLDYDFLPSISKTILTPVGWYAATGFFGTQVAQNSPPYTAMEAGLSLVALLACGAAALLALQRYLAWQESRV